jgi:hypothetical protein
MLGNSAASAAVVRLTAGKVRLAFVVTTHLGNLQAHKDRRAIATLSVRGVAL